MVREALARAQFDVGMYDEARAELRVDHRDRPGRRLLAVRPRARGDQARRPRRRGRAPRARRGDAPRHRLLRHRAARRPGGADRLPALSGPPGAGGAGRLRPAARRRPTTPPCTTSTACSTSAGDPVPHAAESVAAARQAGLRAAYVTNNASRRPGRRRRAPVRAGDPGGAATTSSPARRRRLGWLAERVPPGSRRARGRHRGARRGGRRGRAAAGAHGRRRAPPRSCRAWRRTRAGPTWPRPRSRCGPARCGWPATPTAPTRARAARCPATAPWSRRSRPRPGGSPVVVGQARAGAAPRVGRAGRRRAPARRRRPARHRRPRRGPRRRPTACWCSPASSTARRCSPRPRAAARRTSRADLRGLLVPHAPVEVDRTASRGAAAPAPGGTAEPCRSTGEGDEALRAACALSWAARRRGAARAARAA